MKAGAAALLGRVIALAVLAGCARSGGGTHGEGGAEAAAASAPVLAPVLAPASSPGPTSTTVAPSEPAPDAGPSYCRVLLGPRELPVRSPVALTVRGEVLEATLNEDGKPQVVAFLAGAVSATLDGAREPLDGASAAGLSVGCAVAGDQVFCPDRGGNVHRTTRAVAGDRLAASARTGSRVAAGLLDGSHPTLAYLSSRQTSEGWVTEAWLAVDDDPPVRVSEDGSGATAITLAQHGAALLVLGVDARSALTAMHARVVTYKEKLHLGEDQVVFVGGPGDRRTGPAVALGPTGAGLGLLPIAKDVGDFGLALVQLDEPPHVDEPVGWSMYLNGLDPAPVAATMGLGASGGAVTWVARVRPVTSAPGSERVLELGDVAGGTLAFVPRYVVAGTTGIIKDASLVVDGHGALWLAWLDGAGSWLERLACK